MKLKYKKNGQVYFLIALLMIVTGSCKRDSFLDVPPKGVLTDQTTFASQSNAELFVNNIYQEIPDANNFDEVLDGWTDNEECGATNMPGHAIIRANALNPGADNATNGPGNWFRWETLYTDIRACNVFLQDAAKNQSAYNASWYTQRVGEVKFMRAFFYSFLFTNYGGVPLLTSPLNNDDGSNIFQPSGTIDQTLAFIEADCDAAAAVLPDKQGSSDLGRPTKGAALTLKGSVELFYASPLVNTTNDVSKWAKAAATNLSVINMGVYSLFNPAGSTTAFKDQFLAINNWNSETIFAKAYALPHGHKREGILGPVILNGGEQAWGNISPTQSLVDDYEMDNGLPITDPASGYDAQHPYINRESRFYQSVVYDGSVWQGQVWQSRIGGNNQIDLGSSSDISNTGYNGRKTLDESINGQTSLGTSPNTSNYQFYRYAEVLLSYAEAQNEAVGPDASVYDAVRQVRARVGLPPLPAGLSQTDMRTDIRRERRIELAFEDKRWYDIRRWDITVKGPAVLNTPEYGMVITTNGSNLIYTPTIVNQNRYSEFMNWLPIPARVIAENPNVKQNPGY